MVKVQTGLEPTSVSKSESACDYQYYLENTIQNKFSIVGPKVDFIFMVGGFSESKYLKKEIINEFEKENI